MPWKWLSADRDDSAPEAGWRTLLKRRAFVALAGCGLWAIAVEARLVQLQILQHPDLAERAEQQHERVLKMTAPRGDIVDRNGRILAYSVGGHAIGADPGKIDDPARTAARLCAVFGDCTAREQSDLATRLNVKKGFVMVRRARAVSPQQAQQVAELKLPGITLIEEPRRYYPNRDLAAHLLGFVGSDDNGLSGVEDTYDEVVHGRPGRVIVQADARRDRGRLQTRVELAPRPGATLELTIDLALQHIVERELRAGVEEHQARGGTAIVMDPRTGEVLALGNYPTFNPNAYGRAPEEDRRNRAIQEIYEPGSTFKIVTASAAIEEGIASPSDLIDCNPGYINIGGRRIPDSHPHGVLTFEDVVVLSSNVGAIKVGQRLGGERLNRYVRRFGFGEVFATGLPGASRGIVFDELSEGALASVSMGYQIGVTPLQMVTAASAVANGGELMEPHLVRAVVRDGVRTVTEPKVLRRAIAPTTAAILTTIMEGVVERGTAKKAKLDRYQVAGKTGTAEKLVDGRYSNVDHNASFVGFVPSRRPEVTILVVIDSPHAGGHFGGDVAAPVFKRIAEAAMQHLGVPPSINAVPPVVVAEAPAALPAVPVQTVHNVMVPVGLPVEGVAAMPDVTGMGLRDAVRVLTAAGIAVRPVGSGVVTTQTPAAGTPLEHGGVVQLELRRTPPTAAKSAGAGR